MDSKSYARRIFEITLYVFFNIIQFSFSPYNCSNNETRIKKADTYYQK